MSRTPPRIALTVERHSAQTFHWVLLESVGAAHEYRKLIESADIYRSYREAFECGLVALWKIAPELDDGPVPAAG